MIQLVAQDKLDAALAKEFVGVDADRKKVLVDHIRGAIARYVAAELHEIFSKNLPEAELAFYNEIVVVNPDEGAAGAVVASQPSPAPESPEAAATAHSEGAEAADAVSARSRSR